MKIINTILKKLTSRKSKALYFALWDCLYPKSPAKVVLVIKNRTEFSGNLRVVADILLDEKKYKVYIYKDGLMVPEIKKVLKEKGATVLEGWTIRSLYHLFTSGMFIFSHAPRDAHITKKCRKRIVINLWHGVAFKTIENLMPNIPKEKQEQIRKNALLYDHIIASSKADKKTNTQAFMVDADKVHITGLPRYEILKESYSLDTFLQKQKSALLAYKKDKTFILYAPTFREHSNSAIEQITNDEWDILSTLLEKSDAIMAIRPHAYDNTLPEHLQGNTNFCWLDHSFFTETNLILQHTDILVVDFSSIWIDFLLLHRPIVGFAKDFKHYSTHERGFVYDFKATFPDVFNHSMHALSKNLELLLHDNIVHRQYQAPLKLFHTYTLETDFRKTIAPIL